MADPVIFIVARLNEAYALGLTLVDFDETPGPALLQVLADVLGDLDAALGISVRDAGLDQSAAHLAGGLKLLKYPPLRDAQDPGARERWVRGAREGNKAQVYPALHWLLEGLERHRTRAYVARFLAPVDVPPELANEPALREALEGHRALQRDFKESHRAVVLARTAAKSGDGDALKAEAQQLGAERAQLTSKVEGLKKRSGDVPDFEKLLAATRGLRLAQDEDQRLRETCARQREAARRAEIGLRRRERRLKALEDGVARARGAQDLLEVMERDAEGLRRAVERDAARNLDPASREDLEVLGQTVAAKEARVLELRERCRAACEARDDPTLRGFRATAQIVRKKLGAREAEVDDLEAKLARGRTALARADGPASDGADGPGDARAFGERLRLVTREYKETQRRLGAYRRELVVAHRTERVLRGRAGDLELFLEREAGARGVRGYRGEQAKLEHMSAGVERSDVSKGAELERAATGARDTAEALRARKGALAPRIAALRGARREFGAMAEAFRLKRRAYDAAAAAAEADVRRLERDCDAHQEAALAEESRFHYLNCLCGVARAADARAAAEAARRGGPAAPRLLPDFAGYAELYAHKGERQRALVDQLRRRKAGLDRGTAPRRLQRARFERLRALLTARLAARLAARGARAPGAAAAEYDLGHARVAQFA